MKNLMKIVTLSIAPMLLLSTLALAEGKAEQGNDQSGLDTSWLSVDGEANMDYFANSNNDYESNLRSQDVRIRLTAEIAKGIKAVIAAKLDRSLIKDGSEVNGEKFDLEKFIEEAYVEIRMDQLTGAPVAVLVGKHAMAFGQNASRLPMFKDNLLYDVSKQDQVMGITVRLDKELLGEVIDSLEVSVYENGAGDLKIGDGAGFSFRMTKQLTEKLKATASAMATQKGSSKEWDDMDKRAAIGVVYDNGNGTWKAYAEGIVFDGYAQNPNASYGGTAGVAVNAGPGEVVAEFSFIEKTAKEVAVAYNIPVGRNLVISPEVRHTMNEDGSDNTRFGIRVKAVFGEEYEARMN